MRSNRSLHRLSSNGYHSNNSKIIFSNHLSSSKGATVTQSSPCHNLLQTHRRIRSLETKHLLLATCLKANSSPPQPLPLLVITTTGTTQLKMQTSKDKATHLTAIRERYQAHHHLSNQLFVSLQLSKLEIRRIHTTHCRKYTTTSPLLLRINSQQ